MADSSGLLVPIQPEATKHVMRALKKNSLPFQNHSFELDRWSLVIESQRGLYESLAMLCIDVAKYDEDIDGEWPSGTSLKLTSSSI